MTNKPTANIGKETGAGSLNQNSGNEITMKTNHEEKLMSIRQQIIQLEQEYESALQQGQQFETLKHIRLSIRALEEVFSQLQYAI